MAVTFSPMVAAIGPTGRIPSICRPAHLRGKSGPGTLETKTLPTGGMWSKSRMLCAPRVRRFARNGGTRRVRSVGQRLEGVEDALDRLESLLGSDGIGGIESRLDAIEKSVARLESQSKPAAKPRTAAKKRAPAKPKA